MNSKLTFFHVSKTDADSFPLLAQQYQDLRLTALQLSASSFSSTYEIESKHPPTYWQTQVSNPEQELFICSATSNPTTPEDVPKPGTWIAQVILRGPTPEERFRLAPVANQPDLPTGKNSTEYWQLKGLYVDPTYRGLAVSQRLIKHAMEWLRESARTSSVDNLWIRAMVRPDNVPSQRLFQKIGFLRNGTCTLREAGLANGEIAWEDRKKAFPEHYDRRGGHIYILDCEV